MTNPAHNLEKLIIYRNLLNDTLIQKILDLVDNPTESGQAEMAYELIRKAESNGLAGNIAQSYFVHLIAQDENILSQQAEKNSGNVGTSLRDATEQDTRLLRSFLFFLNNRFQNTILASYEPTSPRSIPGCDAICAALLDNSLSDQAAAALLINHYAMHGYGSLAQYRAFRWIAGQGLVGVDNFDSITFGDIIGYEKQKRLLISNTEAFVQKKHCNNVLLTGARGTGKSSSVKALINQYYQQGLRLVEVAKHDQADLHNLLHCLSGLSKRFIVYLDDLSFEENESEYKHLKSILEGGAGTKPANVLIYATSNRQHLIRETWKDRSNDVEDLHRFDTVNEKLSLSDRFGLTVTFLAPNQEEYMSIVEGLAQKHKISMPSAELRAEALKWEMTHSGRSGRLARQFIHHILGSA